MIIAPCAPKPAKLKRLETVHPFHETRSSFKTVSRQCFLPGNDSGWKLLQGEGANSVPVFSDPPRWTLDLCSYKTLDDMDGTLTATSTKLPDHPVPKVPYIGGHDLDSFTPFHTSPLGRFCTSPDKTTNSKGH